MPFFSRSATAGVIALAVFSTFVNLPILADGDWDAATLATPNKDALVLAGGGDGHACDTTHHTVLTALGVTAADRAQMTQDCPAELAIFRKGAAMSMMPFNATGGAPAGPLPKVARRLAEVRFFILAECLDGNGNVDNRFACAKRHLTLARRVFDEQLTGITFPGVTSSGLFTDRVGAPDTTDLTVDCDDAINVAKLRTIAPPTTTSITVYYIIGTTAGPRGFTCSNGQMVIIGRTAGPDTLAHEFGHALAFGLQHYNPTENGRFDNRNLMIGDDFRGEMLTLGQSFRFNLNKSSMLNQPAPSLPLPLRDCGETSTTECPPVRLDPRS